MTLPSPSSSAETSTKNGCPVLILQTSCVMCRRRHNITFRVEYTCIDILRRICTTIQQGILITYIVITIQIMATISWYFQCNDNSLTNALSWTFCILKFVSKFHWYLFQKMQWAYITMGSGKSGQNIGKHICFTNFLWGLDTVILL